MTDYHFVGIKNHEFLELNSLKSFSRTTGKVFAKVLIIELDSEDGDQVRGLSVDLTEGLNRCLTRLTDQGAFNPCGLSMS